MMERANAPAVDTPWQRLMHRWFVQYNPLYLVSAMLCLVGVRLTLRGVAEQDDALGALGVAAVTELYAAALIGGAALLTRIGQRRPGVMLALLAALYQGDVALHTEACAYLGALGLAAAAAWGVVFVAKLYALAWAVKLRPSRGAIGLVAYGGVGLAVVPQLLARMAGEAPRGVLVALWLYSVAAAGLEVSRGVASLAPLDDWGRTVLRRSLRAVWLLWPLVLALHVVYWSALFSVSLVALVPAALLVATRYARGESRVWAVVATTLLGAALAAPRLFWLSAVMAAATLALRAYRYVQAASDAAGAAGAETALPFRAADASRAASGTAQVATRAWSLALAAPGARRRFLVGALFAAYLAVWTSGWSGGPWPLHVLWLDLSLTGVVALLAARLRARVALAPLALSYAHLLVQARVVTAPQTSFAWGAASMAGAFALLLASLAASWWLRGVQALAGERRGPAREGDGSGEFDRVAPGSARRDVQGAGGAAAR